MRKNRIVLRVAKVVNHNETCMNTVRPKRNKQDELCKVLHVSYIACVFSV